MEDSPAGNKSDRSSKKYSNTKCDVAEEIPLNSNVSNPKHDKNSPRSENLHYYFAQYCAATSIHGIQYIGERGRFIIERILWSIVLFILSCFCIFLIAKSYKKWQTSPVIVTFATTETPIWEVPFPAVTICPEVKTNPEVFNYTDVYLRKLFEQNVTEEEENAFNNLALVCQGIFQLKILENLTTNLTVTSDIINDIVTLFESSFSNETIETYWLGKEVIDMEFTRTLTEEGVCISFNMISADHILRDPKSYLMSENNMSNVNKWSLGTGYASDAGLDANPKRTFTSGLRGGAQFYLFTNHSHLSYMCGDGVQGFKVMIHHPFELPDINKFIRLPLDEYVQVGIKPKMMTVSESLKSYSPDIRNCYFSDQRRLKYFTNYTQNNCMSECLANYTLSECKCLPFYMPKDSHTPICGLGSLSCVEQCKVDIGNPVVDTGNWTNCDCLPSCASLEYDIEISQSKWNWRNFFLLLEKIAGQKLDIINFKKDHVSSLTVYYKELQFMTSERHELYGYVDFFSNTGGLLGLFVGFSVTSAIEILYFLTLRLICNIKKYGKRVWSGDSQLLQNEKEDRFICN